MGADGAAAVLITYRVLDPDGFSIYLREERMLSAAAGGHAVVEAGELFDPDGLFDRMSLLRFYDADSAAAWVGSDELHALQRAHEWHLDARLTVIADAAFGASDR